MMIAFFKLLLFLCCLEPQDSEVLYETALIYEKGNDSVMADPTKSTYFYRMAAMKGHTGAQNYLGFRYYNGEGIKQNVDSALFWIRKAAEAGDVKAAGNLGFLLTKAPDVPHDYEEGFRWLSLAVDSGLPVAYTQLADLYRNGLGCDPDTLKAIELYDRAINARIGDAPQRLLAMMGYKWKELSPDSALNLGLKYYPAPAPIVGIDLIENAAEKNEPRAIALLADAYSRGLTVEYNHDLSNFYFLKAALLGNPSAQYIIAELLEFFPDALDDFEELYSQQEDTPFPPEMKTADFWYLKAEENGVVNAEQAYTALFAH